MQVNHKQDSDVFSKKCVTAFLTILCLTVSVREDKGDQILDYTEEIQTMEEQLKKLQKEVHTQLWDVLLLLK